MLEKAKVQDNKKKIPFGGTSLNDQNSFVILGNDDIAALANDMGVEICLQHFDTIDLMKDLEVARHALEKQKISAPPESVVENKNVELENIDVPLLEWLDDDSEVELFTIVQSRKKKKKQAQLQLENLVKNEPIRRSQRNVPSICRNRGGQENPIPTR
jgi:hypothetical protein